MGCKRYIRSVYIVPDVNNVYNVYSGYTVIKGTTAHNAQILQTTYTMSTLITNSTGNTNDPANQCPVRQQINLTGKMDLATIGLINPIESNQHAYPKTAASVTDLRTNISCCFLVSTTFYTFTAQSNAKSCE